MVVKVNTYFIDLESTLNNKVKVIFRTLQENFFKKIAAGLQEQKEGSGLCGKVSPFCTPTSRKQSSPQVCRTSE